jgi:hypothetical protein
MRFKDIQEMFSEYDFEDFTDRTDASIEISLMEYGLIRNPETNVCIQYNDYPDMARQITIDIDEVRDALEEATGYYSYIGSDKETELTSLDNNYLSHHITALRDYDGFNQIY